MFVYRNVHAISVTAQDTIRKTLETFNKAKLALVISHVDGGLVGVVTESDIRKALLSGATLDDKIGQFMTIDPVYLTNDTISSELVQILQDPRFKGRLPDLLPVIDKNTHMPLGLYRTSDLLFRGTKSDEDHIEDKVVILGGAGYIGSVLVHLLLSLGYKVTVLDIFRYGRRSLSALHDHPHLEIHDIDTRHSDKLVEPLQGAKAVVHLAELVGDPLCGNEPKVTLEVNYLATCTLARICTYLNIPRFIYMSSCSVYGASENTDAVLTETSPLNPVSLYAKTKINAERALLSMASSEFAPTIFRLGTVFGLSHRPRFDLIVNILTARAISKGHFTIFGGEQWRPLVHVKDICLAITQALNAPLNVVGNQVFNIVGFNHKLSKVGEIVSEAIPDSVMHIDSKITDERNYNVSADKAKNSFAFDPFISVYDGVCEIADVWDDWFDNGKYRLSGYYNHYVPE